MEQTYFIIEKSTGVKFALLYDGDGIVDIEQRGNLEPESEIILAQINRIADAFEYNHGNIFNFTIGMGLDSEDEILHTFSGCFDLRMDEILNEDWGSYSDEGYHRSKYGRVKYSRNIDNLEYGDILIKFVSEFEEDDYEVITSIESVVNIGRDITSISLKEGPNGKFVIPYEVAKNLEDPGYFYEKETDVGFIEYEFFNMPLEIVYN